MLQLSRLVFGSSLPLLVSLVTACGGTVYENGGQQGAGGSHSGGSVSSGSSSGVGGSSVGGSSQGTGGSSSFGRCLIDSDCVGAFDTNDSCYSPDCSSPIAASKMDLLNDACLVEWRDHADGVRSNCELEAGPGCDASCAVQPECLVPSCIGGACHIAIGQIGVDCFGNSCDQLFESYQSALAAAQACDPNVDSIQCNGTLTVADFCNCQVLVNEAHPELAEAAEKARQAWTESCPQPPCLPGCSMIGVGYCSADGICAAE